MSIAYPIVEKIGSFQAGGGFQHLKMTYAKKMKTNGRLHLQS